MDLLWKINKWKKDSFSIKSSIKHFSLCVDCRIRSSVSWSRSGEAEKRPAERTNAGAGDWAKRQRAGNASIWTFILKQQDLSVRVCFFCNRGVVFFPLEVCGSLSPFYPIKEFPVSFNAEDNFHTMWKVCDDQCNFNFMTIGMMVSDISDIFWYNHYAP